MDELRDMHSTVNSLEGVKEKYKKGVIENFKYILENQRTIIQNNKNGYEEEEWGLRHAFDNKQYNECYDDSLGSNDRWGIVAGKNLFGLEASILPEDEKGKSKRNMTEEEKKAAQKKSEATKERNAKKQAESQDN